MADQCFNNRCQLRPTKVIEPTYGQTQPSQQSQQSSTAKEYPKAKDSQELRAQWLHYTKKGDGKSVKSFSENTVKEIDTLLGNNKDKKSDQTITFSEKKDPSKSVNKEIVFTVDPSKKDTTPNFSFLQYTDTGYKKWSTSSQRKNLSNISEAGIYDISIKRLADGKDQYTISLKHSYVGAVKIEHEGKSLTAYSDFSNGSASIVPDVKKEAPKLTPPPPPEAKYPDTKKAAPQPNIPIPNTKPEANKPIPSVPKPEVEKTTPPPVRLPATETKPEVKKPEVAKPPVPPPVVPPPVVKVPEPPVIPTPPIPPAVPTPPKQETPTPKPMPPAPPPVDQQAAPPAPPKPEEPQAKPSIKPSTPEIPLPPTIDEIEAKAAERIEMPKAKVEEKPSVPLVEDIFADEPAKTPNKKSEAQQTTPTTAEIIQKRTTALKEVLERATSVATMMNDKLDFLISYSKATPGISAEQWSIVQKGENSSGQLINIGIDATGDLIYSIGVPITSNFHGANPLSQLDENQHKPKTNVKFELFKTKLDGLQRATNETDIASAKKDAIESLESKK